jgi:hypothetical protein
MVDEPDNLVLEILHSSVIGHGIELDATSAQDQF